MKIITYTAVAVGEDFESIPENMRAAACIVPAGPGTHWITTGPTPQAAEAKLRAFMATQAKKWGGESKKRPTGKIHGLATDVGDVI